MGIIENWKWGYTSQKEWGWPVAIEIFCGGTAGGTYILSILPYLLFSGRIFLTGVYASLVLVLISIFVLVAESTFLWRLPRAFFNIKSPLTLGAISLSLLIIFSIATVGILSTGFASRASYVMGWLGVAVSLLAIIYPGALMGLMKAIPFWSGSGPSLLLLSAALVSGCAVVTLAGGLGHVNFDLSRVTLGLLVIHGLSLLIYIMTGGQGSKAAHISVQRLIKGNLFFIFMIGAMGVGLVVPSVLYIIGILSSSTFMFHIGSGLILIGGILMRYSLIASGVKIPMLSEDSIGATYWLYH
jgi:formate-dependent nitrite reductase membrane component NrfD